MPELRSGLYAGSVMHHRLRPRQHRLRYSIFYLLLDLDEIDVLENRLRLFSHNRFNLFSFHDRDHGEGTQSPRDRIIRHLDEAGIETGGPIRLLTMPRILGYAFNPLSLYFCHRRDGSLSAIFYEVNNTFGQRHNYLIPVAPGTTGPVRQESQKSFYVSPFMTTDMIYSFSIMPPGQDLSVSVTGRDDEGPLIIAKLTAVRQDLSDASLARAFFVYAHHIQRLMITGNFALLIGVRPAELKEWYLAVYADAFDWVELPNTHGMVLFADGGLLASKPYAGSGAYIDRMSDYCGTCAYNPNIKRGPGACPFNFLYWNFLIENRSYLERNPRMGMPYRTLDRMPKDRVKVITQDAHAFIEGL